MDNSSEMEGSSDGSGSDTEPELMVTTREKRATAGNRYQQVVAQEELAEAEAEVEDDDVALLFAEGDEEDEEYNSEQGADDADMSSSDDDDQGPNAGADGLEGEKDIEKAAKVERAKKRKADMALTSIQGLKKKPKFDPTSLRKTAAPIATKRKERVSWLPEQTVTTGRTSLRAQTIAHREETHAKLKVNEEQRLKMKAIREKREREREADAPKELTQADRLAEAERIERKNAKSLNRWETMERKRAEEQAAKLAALKNRKLDGAVLSWHSASHVYFGLKSERAIPSEVPPEAKKRGRKPKAFHEQMAAARLAELNAIKTEDAQTPGLISTSENHTVPTSSSTPITPQGPTPLQGTSPAPHAPGDFLTGIHEYASQHPAQATSALPNQKKTSKDLESSPQVPEATPSSAMEVDNKPASISVDQTNNDSQMEDSVVEPPTSTPRRGSIIVPTLQVSNETHDRALVHAIGENNERTAVTEQTNHLPRLITADLQQDPDTIVIGVSPDNLDSSVPATPLPEVISTRNLVILEGFDQLSGQTRTEYGLFFNNRKSSRPSKHTTELCPMTGLPSKYRDPATGIGYANVSAYKKLQELKKYQHVWSSMLQCYVGRSNFVARGVPEGFSSS